MITSVVKARRKKAAPCPSPAPPNTPAGPCPARRRPVVLSRHPRSRGARCAEVAGGTAADCTAVCCCCPCGLVALLVLAVVRIPAVLCRRAFLRCKHIKTSVAARRRKCGEGAAAVDVGAKRVGVPGPRVLAAEEDGEVGFGFAVGEGGRGNDDHSGVGWSPTERSPAAEVSEVEKEMLARFYDGGFWRSASRREM